MNGGEIDEKDSELFGLACDDKIIEFFNRLPSVLPPIEALKYFSKITEFETMIRTDLQKEKDANGRDEKNK